ncbi:MAG TPA: hypothetical protein VHM02_14950 [Thermoanaerobaculia bacterium]|nr:hypothetical protein [Thermoanaerobaculia bacterium]
MSIRWAAALAALLAAGAAATAGAAEGGGRAPVAATAHFAFHSDLATNLHDALLVAGRARGRGEPEPLRAGGEAECFAALAPAVRAGWERAVDYYAEVLSPTSWSDDEQFALRLALAGVEDGPDDQATKDVVRVTRGLLAAAQPAYEACRWPAQDAANRRWIADLLPLLETHEATLARRLERLYATPWHGLPLDVDVVAHAPPVGANSILRSPAGGHLLVSVDNRGLQALETVFHEASHTVSAGWRGDPLPTALRRAADELGVELPRDLWHVVLFYTTGETVRRTLAEAGETGYVPYLEAGLWDGPWGRFRGAIEAVWPAYLAGERDLASAARELVRRVAAEAAPSDP